MKYRNLKEEMKVTYLNEQRIIRLGPKHAINQHPRDLTRNNILRHPEFDLLRRLIRQEPQQVMINPIQILAMLPGIIQPLRCDLGELTRPQETRRHKRIHG